MSDHDSQSHNFPKISNPAISALTHAGYTSLESLTQATEKEIANLHGMGPKGMRILKAAMQEKGLQFAPTKPKKA